ncbi:hypothetical protein BD809_107161 [Aquimarina intermedia]|uniref:YhhN-like protein n=1 Tax=Aquimarina intermedia TaxID=350814 RepID=A0A5S5C1H1_9FLAO|nr:hypothetical protein BD809_107161 [Aquimarina intermedia]
MNKKSVFLFSIALVVLVVVIVCFERSNLIFLKPVITLLLVWVFYFHKKWSNRWFYISMFLIIINDTLVYLDFSMYFRVISVVISLFYVACTLALKQFIRFERIKIKELLTLPVITSFVLVIYLMISVVDMIAPNLKNSVSFFIAICTTQLNFVGVCMYIYLVNRYKGSFLLFISVCCCLFVNAFLPINEFYYYHVAFTVVINIAESLGLFFYTKFLVEAREREVVKEKNIYL